MRHFLLLLALPSFAAAEPGLPALITPAVQEALAAIQSAFPRPMAGGAVTKQKAAPGTATVRSDWRRYSYDGPSRRSYDCVPALQALNAALDMTESRRGSSGCSGGRGLFADWRTLTPLKEGETPDGAVVEAVWVRATVQITVSDPRGCVAYADTLDYLLERLPVRGVSQTVFCQQGSGYISASFEYLAAN